MVPRLEQVAAAGELVHVAEQRLRADEQLAEVEDAAHLERAAVAGRGDAEHLPHGAREDGVQVAAERADRVGHGRRRGHHQRPVGLARGLARVGLGRVVVRDPLPRRARLGEDVRAEAIEHALQLRRAQSAFLQTRRRAHEPADVGGQECVARVVDGAAVEKRLDSAGHGAENRRDPLHAPSARLRHRQAAGAGARDAPQHARRHRAPLEQRGKSRTQPVLAEVGQQQRDVLVVARPRPADAERVVERLLDEPRHLGFVGDVEARVEVGLERKLAQQREAEGVDGADGDVVEPVAQLAPARVVFGGMFGGLPQRAQDALAHLGRRLPRERHRQDVPGIDARPQQVHVAVHQHARLPRAGRRLEDDVPGRVHRITAGLGVAQRGRAARRRQRRIAVGPARVTRHGRSPSGTRRRTRSTCTGTPLPAPAGTPRARCRRRPARDGPHPPPAPRPGPPRLWPAVRSARLCRTRCTRRRTPATIPRAPSSSRWRAAAA